MDNNIKLYCSEAAKKLKKNHKQLSDKMFGVGFSLKSTQKFSITFERKSIGVKLILAVDLTHPSLPYGLSVSDGLEHINHHSDDLKAYDLCDNYIHFTDEEYIEQFVKIIRKNIKLEVIDKSTTKLS